MADATETVGDKKPAVDDSTGEVAEGDENKEPAVAEEQQDPNGYPDPIPDDWKEGRAKNADDWFAQVVAKSHKKFHDTKDEAAAAETAVKVSRMELDATNMDLADFAAAIKKRRQGESDGIQRLIDVAVEQSNSTNRHVIRFPHYTAVRPITVLHDPGAGFRERMFVRALVSSLVANCKPVGSADMSSSRRHGYGQQLVWWENLQPRMAMRDAHICRMEALQRCQVAVLVLSQGLVTRPEFRAEKELIMSRLCTPGPDGAPSMRLVVLRYSSDPLRQPPSFPVPHLPKGHSMVPGAALLGGVPLVSPAEVKVPQTTPAQQVIGAMESMRSCLLMVGIEFEEEIEFFYHPRPALDFLVTATKSPLTTQRLNGSLGGDQAYSDMLTTSAAASGNTLTSIRMGPAVSPEDTGVSWAAAHQLPSPLGLSKPLADWSMHDVQVWIRSMGKSYDRYCWGINRCNVDGWLLSVAGDDELCNVLGIDCPKARVAILENLGGTMKKTSQFKSTANLLPSDGEVPELYSLPDDQLNQVLIDIFHYYDVDGSADLNAGELASLLAAAGITDLTSQVMEVYDQDQDRRLNIDECTPLLKDIWRLLLASRDASLWNMLPPPPAQGYDDDDDYYDNEGQAHMYNAVAGAKSMCSTIAEAAAKSLRANLALHPPSPSASSSHPSTKSATRSSGGGGGGRSGGGGDSRIPGRISFAPGVSSHTTPRVVARPSGYTSQSDGDLLCGGDSDPVGRVSFLHSAGESEEESRGGKDAHKRTSIKLQPAPSANASMQPGHAPGHGAGHTLANAWGGAMSTRGDGGPDHDTMSTSETVADANLDTGDWGSRVTMREKSQAKELGHALSEAVKMIDYRRSGFIDAATLRSMVTFGTTRPSLSDSMPSGYLAVPAVDKPELTPFELRLLSKCMEGLAKQGMAPLQVDAHLLSSSLSLISARHFVASAVRDVTHSQEEMVEAVYSESGTKLLLIKLHTQIRPPADQFEGTRVVNMDDAKQLMDIILTKLQLRLPAFVQTAILKEAYAIATSQEAVGSEVVVWASTVSHMVHVFSLL